jgi:hypothetical protein
MNERENADQLTEAEIAALLMRSESASKGPRSEFIIYQPQDPELFEQISRYLSHPDAFGPAKEASLTPQERIIAMTNALDETIMHDPRREQASGFLSFDVRGITLNDDTCISLQRKAALGELAVTVSHRFAESPKFPRVVSEAFKITDKGEFVMEQSELHIPGDGCMPVEVAKFDFDHSDFTQEVAEKFDYFTHLVQPYLLLY